MKKVVLAGLMLALFVGFVHATKSIVIHRPALRNE
jgi:hypothetical protein